NTLGATYRKWYLLPHYLCLIVKPKISIVF
ncbi:MAG: hypothetical protein ACI83B_003457, partial [Sediminicola sp.]